MLIILLGVLAVLFVAAGVIDFRARRRRLRYRGVDTAASRNRRYSADAAEADMRGKMGNNGLGGGPF